MAKKQTTIKAGLFAKTSAPTPLAPTTTATLPTPQANRAEVFDPSDKRRRPEATKVKAMSVSLTNAEYEEIDRVAIPIGAKRMTLMNAAVRYTMALIREGKLKAKSDTQNGRVVILFE